MLSLLQPQPEQTERKWEKVYREIRLDFTPEEVLDYLRKSQSDDPLLTVEEVLEKHESLLDEWAEKNLGGKVPEENKYREVVSGETLKDRPEINKVLRRIESPKIKAVKVVEPQRLTRGDLEDIGRLMKLLKHTNTIVITPTKIYDLRDEYDWDAFERELKRGNDYLEYYKKIQARGRLLSVSQGNYLGSVPPYGFDKITVKDGKKECPTLKENKEQADVVRLIFDLYVNKGYGQHRICNHLNSLGIQAPKGGHWSSNSIVDMVSNVHYIGKVKWNWRKHITVVEESEFRKTRPKAKIGEYLVFEGRHDGIVAEEIFNAAQERKGKNPKAKTKNGVRNPLVGLIFCRTCGRAMNMQTYKNKDGTEKDRPRLYCPDQKHCNTGSCVFEDIIDRVCFALEQCIEDFEIRIKNDEGDSIKLHANLIKNLEKRKKEIEARELSQWEAQSHPDESQRMPVAIFKQLNEKLLKEKAEIQEALCNAYEAMPDPVDYEEKLATLKDALDALRDPNVEPLKKNMFLKACIERIEYHRERPQRLSENVTKYTQWTNPPIELDVKLKV